MSNYIWSKYQIRNILKYLESSPMCVRTYEEYGNRIFLIQNEEDLVNVMLTLLSEWNDCEWVPQIDWYFNGTYEEYFFEEMGFNPIWFDTHLKSIKSPNHYMQKLIDNANNLKRCYEDQRKGLADAEFVADILENGLADRAGKLYNLLDELTYNDKKMFDLRKFD